MASTRDVICLVILSLVFYASPSRAQMGVDWNNLRGENAEAGNSTTEDAIRDFLTNIWQQFQESGELPLPFPPGGGGGGGGGGGVDADGENVTIIPVTEVVTEGEGGRKFPPGFENLQYISPVCLNHTMTLIQDFLAQKRYAKQMVYSSGSPPDPSIEFSGNVIDYGLFYQCKAIQEKEEDVPFDAEYCVATAYIEGAPGGVYAGLCAPASCPDYDLEAIITILLGVIPDFPSAYIDVNCENPLPFSGADIFVIFLCSLLGFLMLIGTTYHLVQIHTKKKRSSSYMEASTEADHEEGAEEANAELEPEDKEKAAAEDDQPQREDMNIQEDPKVTSKSSNGKLDKVLMSFSVIHNFGKIFDTTQPKGTLSALNGLRVISMFWIILGHTWQFLGTWRTDNQTYLYTQLFPKFWVQTILHAVFAVDTFFLLSGLLLTYLTLKKGDGKIKWGLFIFHRYYRITPMYMLVLGVWAALPKHILDGPGVNIFFGGSGEQCRNYWWTNLLYINNLHPFPGDLGAQCMGWSWYLANDMQFFILSPPIIYLLYKKRNAGFALIGALFLMSYCSTIGIAYYYGLNIGFNQIPFNNRTADHPTADHLYGKPYHRIQPYLVGILFGYALYRLEGKKFEIPRLVCAAAWLAAAGSSLGLVYGLYNTTQGHIVSQGTTIFYYVINATVWGLSVGWVAFACIKGYGGPVNKLLSWPIWTPLSRLTFGAYLVHPIVQFGYIFSLPSGMPASVAVGTFHWIAFIFVSYAAGLVFSLAIEAPLMGLEKIWFKRH